MDSCEAQSVTIHETKLCMLLVKAGRFDRVLLDVPGRGLKCMLRISRYVSDEMPSKNVCVLPRKKDKKNI